MINIICAFGIFGIFITDNKPKLPERRLFRYALCENHTEQAVCVRKGSGIRNYYTMLEEGVLEAHQEIKG